MRDKYLRQARLTFNGALTLIIVGAAIMLVGIVLAYGSALSVGLVTAATDSTRT